MKQTNTIKAKYDPEVDALYIHLKKGKVDHTEATEYCIVDYDAKGIVLGLEILSYSKSPALNLLD